MSIKLRDALIKIECISSLVAENCNDQKTIQYMRDIITTVNSALGEPIRNCEKYNTADEAYDGFRKFCNKSVCSKCRFDENPTTCRLSWLYSEVEKEEESK